MLSAPKRLSSLAVVFAALCAASPAFAAPRPYLLGPPAAKAGFENPAAADERDPLEYAPGYYNGDALPPSTIYLTFDDGPSDFTDAVLDILRAKEVSATFFINSFVRNAPRGGDPYANGLLPRAATLRRMAAEGHAIGNHTFSHRNLATQNADVVERELDLLAQHFRAAYGPGAPTLHLIRPPFGSPWLGKWNNETDRRKVSDVIAKRGLVAMWGEMWDSGDSREWVKGEWFTAASPLYSPGTEAYRKKVQRQLDRLLRMADGVRSGVVLMHDMHPTSRDMLPRLIDELKKRGYVFQTMEDYARWRWGPHVFDRFHQNDPDALPKAPDLPGITQAMLASRPFPPNQATAPRIGLKSPPNQATAPRLVFGRAHPANPPLADWDRTRSPGESAGLPDWLPRIILPPPSDSEMAASPEAVGDRSLSMAMDADARN